MVIWGMMWILHHQKKISKISINLPMLMELDLFVLGSYTLLILVQSGLK